MANATRRGNVGTTPFNDTVTKVPMVNTAQVFYANAMIGLGVNGYGDKMDDAAIKQFVGVTAGVQAEVLTGGNNGDVLMDVVQERFLTCTIAAGAVADIGRIVYASDDQTVALTPGAFGNVIGRIVYIVSATVVIVEAIYANREGGGKPFQIASANGAIPIKTSVVFITKGSAAVLTLADPTSGVNDGVRITVISTTAFAHTLTNAGSGFNAGGAASDVGTYAAAAGNQLTVIAYLGKWYVESNTGVTLA